MNDRVSTSPDEVKDSGGDKKLSKGDIYLDSCIFLFDLFGTPEYRDSCREILESNDRRKATSVVTLYEVVYQLMLDETWRTYRLKRKSAAKVFLYQSPRIIQELIEPWKILDYLEERNVEVLAVTRDTIKLALVLSKTYGLSNNDSIHLASCFENGIKTIGSSDMMFDGVKGIDVWRP